MKKRSYLVELEELRNANEALRKSLEEFISIRDGARKILSARAPKDVALSFSDVAKELLGIENLEFYLYDENTQQYKGLLNEAGYKLEPSKEVIDWTVRENKPTTLPVGDGNFITILPLLVKEHLVGVICLDTSKIADSISQQALELLTTLSSQAAISILNAKLFLTIQSQYNLLNNILDSITNGIITMDNNFTITKVNRNAMAMLELPTEVSGIFYQKLLPAELSKIIEEMSRELREEGFAMERQFNYKLSSGVELPLAVGVSLLRDEKFSPTGIIVILRDMTATRELERLRKLDQLKSEFVANVSHDLKTPLTSIKAYTEALQDMLKDMTQREFLGVIQEESDRLLSMITDLLSISRIQAGKLKINLELVDPRLIVQEIVGVSKIQSDKHDIKIFFADDLPAQMLIDKERMKEAIINLLSNAIKYSPDGGEVFVKMDIFESNLRISVKDHGIGIPQESLPYIFDQFYRVDGSMTTPIQGSGLGLTIVKGIIEAHGGKITVESKVGEGSTFTVFLPIRREIPPEQREFGEGFV
jgi:two-component system OmpR family sensor kinase